MRLGSVLLSLAILSCVGAPSVTAQQEQEKSVVAVVRFDNNTGDEQYENLGRAFSSMMISDLSVLDRIQLVERERLEELLAELDLQQSAYVDPNSAQDLGMILGAQYVVVGAFVTVEPQMRLDTRVARVETSEIVATAEVTGQRDSLFNLQQRLADQLLAGFDLVLTEEERARLREQQDVNRIDDLAAVVAFSQGLCLLDHGAYADALEVMQDAQLAASGSQLVRATMNTVRAQAEEEAKDRVVNEAGRRVGGLLGRDPAPEPQSPRPAAC